MTITEAQDALQALLEGDTDTPAEGSDEWNFRLELLNDGKSHWRDQEGMRWNELYKLDSSSLVPNGSATAFTLPADFGELTGKIGVVGTDTTQPTYYKVIPTYEAHQYIGKTYEYTYITTVSGVKKLNFFSAPSTGTTIYLPYYSTSPDLASGSDDLPMSKPRFVIYWALAKIAEQSDDYDRVNLNMQMADELMMSMKTANETLGYYQSNTIPDGMEGLGY